MKQEGNVRKSLDWVDDRTGLVSVAEHAMFHKVPRSAKWWYVFGSASMTSLWRSGKLWVPKRPHITRSEGPNRSQSRSAKSAKIGAWAWS